MTHITNYPKYLPLVSCYILEKEPSKKYQRNENRMRTTDDATLTPSSAPTRTTEPNLLHRLILQEQDKFGDRPL